MARETSEAPPGMDHRPQTTDRKTESTDHVARRLKPAGLTEFTRNF